MLHANEDLLQSKYLNVNIILHEIIWDSLNNVYPYMNFCLFIDNFIILYINLVKEIKVHIPQYLKKQPKYYNFVVVFYDLVFENYLIIYTIQISIQIWHISNSTWTDMICRNMKVRLPFVWSSYVKELVQLKNIEMQNLRSVNLLDQMWGLTTKWVAS